MLSPCLLIEPQPLVWERYPPCSIPGALDVPEGSGVMLCGLVTTVRAITTAKGYPMASVTFASDSRAIEAVVFPRPFREYGALLLSGEKLCLKGRIDKHAGVVVLVDEVEVEVVGGDF